jgi:hypothetical protein
MLLAVPAPAQAQQSFVNVVGAVQVATGDANRLGGQNHIEPDLGIQVFDSTFATGTLRADVNVTRRDETAVLGRSLLAIDDLKAGGLTWSLAAGDVWAPAAVPSFGFSNLFAPPVTLAGARLTAVNRETALDVAAGRVTALRNLFGTDTYPVGQNVYQASLSHRRGSRLDLHARGSYVGGAGTQPYASLTDNALGAGAGARYRLRPSVEFAADAGYTRFRRRGAQEAEQAPSGIAGAHVSLPKGWLQLNAQRLPLGTYPVFTSPYLDRSGVFAAGEYDVGREVRLFGGVEFVQTDLDPEPAGQAAASVPPGTQSRGHGGVRLRVADRSTLSARAEGGGRDIRPSRFGPGFATDTTVFTGEWHGGFNRGNMFLRYDRRNSADLRNPDQGYLQHDAVAQAYFGLASGAQVFVQGVFSRRADEAGTGQTLWQASGGTQFSYRKSYVRVEANASRTAERLTGQVVSRQGVSAGFSGQVARDTYVSIDCYVDHTPLPTLSGNPWVTRSMVRLTRSFPFGAPRASAAGGRSPVRGPSGGIAGVVFADWDGDGQPGPGEEPIDGIGVSLGPLGSATTAAGGHFAFTGVPAGSQAISLDLTTVPALFDPPADAIRTVEVSRNAASNVAFGLVPLGAAGGAVYQDTDGNGVVSEADTPIDGAVLVLDNGARTEVTKAGKVRFDAIRFGTHAVTLLVGSLPEGAELAGPATVEVVMTREVQEPRFEFLVKLEKRPEVRKVFPPKPPQAPAPKDAKRSGGPL